VIAIISSALARDDVDIDSVAATWVLLVLVLLSAGCAVTRILLIYSVDSINDRMKKTVRQERFDSLGMKIFFIPTYRLAPYVACCWSHSYIPPYKLFCGVYGFCQLLEPQKYFFTSVIFGVLGKLSTQLFKK
jgi:hypothetical protein